MANQVETAESLENRIASLTKNLLECYEELDLIYRLSRKGLSSLEAQTTVDFILAEAMEIFDADTGWVIPGEMSEELFEPTGERCSRKTMIVVQDHLVRDLLAAGKSVVVDCLKDEMPTSGAEIPESFLCAVISTEQSVYGALCVGKMKGKREFTAGDLKLAQVMASQAAVALENVQLHKKRLDEEQRIIRLQEEVRLARSIQTNLLPKGVPDISGYDVAGVTIPAQSVGGDYYDFIAMDGNRLALCLGDVSGKGMPAALLMAHLQAAIRGQTLMNASPAECLSRSNTLLYQSTDDDRFASCFYGILDTKAHCLRYANAGHDRPLVVNGNGSPRSLDSAGLVLGLVEDVAYSEMTQPLNRGDAMVIYSDGIIDAANHDNHEFGLKRLTSLVQNGGNASASDLLARIMSEVGGHAGSAPQTDDMTLVVVRREA